MFNKRLNEARKARGITAKEMAERLDTGLRNYRKYESGDARPSYEALVEIAKYFGVTTDYLLGNEDPSGDD